MHIPDGFLDIKTSLITNLISAIFIFISIKKINTNLNPQRIPLMGISSTFVFTIQLLSFPVFSGTSVHLLGSVLVAVLLGPFCGFLVVSCSLILHSLFFQHGGVLTLGANILNIAVVGCFLGYLIYKIYPTNISAAFSAFLTTMIGAFLCSVELFLSNKSPIKQTLIAMSSFHIIGGIIEAVVTFLILNLIYKVKPEIKELEKI